MPNLKEIFERAQATGKVEYTYFGGNIFTAPFNQTSIGFGDPNDPYIQLGYDPKTKFSPNDPTGTINLALSSARDTLRLGKFITDGYKGVLWQTKQSGLQLSNPEVSFDQRLSNNDPRIYSTANTLAQIPVNGLGIHLTRHGINPLNDVGYITLNTTNGNNIDLQSRLGTYYDQLSTQPNNVGGQITLRNYLGGPDSTYGIGRTITQTYADSFALNTGETDKDGIDPSANQQYMGFQPWSYNLIRTYGVFESKNPLTDTGLQENTAKYPLDFTGREDYPLQNIHTRIGVTSNANDPIGSYNTVDSVNILKITPSKTFFDNSSNATQKIDNTSMIYTKGYTPESIIGNKIKPGKINGFYGRDLIKFRLEFLNNDQPVIGTEINTDVLAFRAYINTMNDNFNSTWKEFNYMGRGEPFYTYEGFKRNISLTFTVFAHSEEEMASVWTKVNYLMSTMAPDYNTKNQMRGNYCYFTVGDYMYRQPGVIDSLQISDLFGDNQTGWEIALNEPDINTVNNAKDKKHYEIPKMLKIQMNFKPIHNFLPKRMYNEEKMPNHTATFVTPNHMLLPSKYNRYLPSKTQEISQDNKPPESKNPTSTNTTSTIINQQPRNSLGRTPQLGPAAGGFQPASLLKTNYTLGNNTQDNTLVNDIRYGRGPRPFVRQDVQFGGGGGFNGGEIGGGF
jgi:hypothetical protein